VSDRITMLNRALLRIGAEPLVSEADPGAPVHLAIYDGVLELLAAQPWSFFKMTRKLARLSTAPVHGWAYAYALPPDRTGPPRGVYFAADNRQPTQAYDLIGDELHTDLEAVWITYLRTVSYERWPGDFRELFVTALMAELALSVREDRTLHDRLYQKAFGTPAQMGVGGLMAAALDMDSQGIPSETVGGGINPLIDVRF
jgi:hypothetical protein